MAEPTPQYSTYPAPDPQTTLDAALERLREGKQLEQRHRTALLEYIADLETLLDQTPLPHEEMELEKYFQDENYGSAAGHGYGV